MLLLDQVILGAKAERKAEAEQAKAQARKLRELIKVVGDAISDSRNTSGGWCYHTTQSWASW